jgi:cytochrome c oxidase accessory protein FixG
VNATDPIIRIKPVTAGTEEVSLYEVRKKIHPRSVGGVFAFWRWTLVIATQLVFYGLPWLAWNDRQAVLFDIAARKFYIGGLVFWPQDVVYLAVLLVISAYGLFLFTAVAGRLWCGYACPQTVYTQMFMWVERRIEGDRPARIRLDGAPLSAEKFAKRAAKHAIWIAISLWTGITFVGYFTPIRELVAHVPLALSGWEAFWVLFYGFATYGNAGWMREQVCKYMCPYARFQSAMFDQDTLTIAYDSGRGEPRGARSRKIDPKDEGLGACVDCSICVQVCPTGIDIRNGLQYECIGCAACIDGCNQVMDKMGYPRGLIRYVSENALAHGYDAKTMWKRAARPRTLIYTAILIAIVAGTAISLASRNPLKVDILRDRGALARETAPGVIENVYRVQIMNTDETPRRYAIEASGVPGLAVAGADLPIAVEAAGSRLVPLRLQAPADAGAPGAHKIVLRVHALEDERVARDEKSTFILPKP